MTKSIYGKNRAATLAASATLALAGTAALASSDYGPAIWHACCNANWYTTGYGHKFCVIHDMEGYYGSTVSYFTSCSHTSSSVYYAVNGLAGDSGDGSSPAGEISQMVSEANYAWHVCCWNQYMFGTEHEGFQSNPAWYTEAMYQASAGLQAHLCNTYGIAKDRNHIIAHGEKSNATWVSWMEGQGYSSTFVTCNSHTDPGPYWDWIHFMALLSPPPLAGPTGFTWVGQDLNGNLEAFALGTNNAIWHNFGQSNSWSGWGNMGGNFAATPAVGRNYNGNLEVFALDAASSNIFHIWQTPGQGNGWSSWGSLGSLAASGTPAVIQRPDGRLEVFVRAQTGAIYHNFQIIGAGWNGWASLGGNFVGNPAGARNSNDGHLEVFAIDASTTHPFHIVETPGQGSGWGSWSDMGSIGSNYSPAVGMNTNGNLEVFVRGHDGAMYHIYQTPGQGNGWSAWANLGGNFKTGPTVQNNQSGNLEVYAVSTNNVVNHIYQTPGQGNGWASWGGISGIGVQGTVGVGRTPDGTETVFTCGLNGTMYYDYQTPGQGNGWNGWVATSGTGFVAPNN